MSIKYGCDFCSYETDKSTNIQRATIAQYGQSLAKEKRAEAGALLPNAHKEPDMCNSCYNKFLEWVEKKLRVYIRDEFPLGKPEEDDNSG